MSPWHSVNHLTVAEGDLSTMVCRPFSNISGTVNRYGFGGLVATYTHTSEGGKECLNVSVNGYPAPHPFDVNRTKCLPPISNGFRLSSASQPSHGYEYLANPNTSFTANTIAAKYYPGIPSGKQMAARLLAGTNPTRPVIRLPVSLFELRDLPMLYHQALTFLTAGRRGDRQGKYWRRLSPTQRLASANLATQFGFLPMIRDVKSLFDFTDSVNKRNKELDRLYSSNGLKRRMTLHRGESNHSKTWTSDPSRSRTTKGKGTIHTWGTVRWKPNTRPSSPGRPSDKEVKRMLLGLTAGDIPANLWNALPWSWLVDWFTNAGDILQANQGRLVCHPTGLCVMNYRTITWTSEPFTIVTTSGTRTETVTISPGYTFHESKLRALPSATLSASIPFLGTGSLSILGSLAVSRGKFSSRTNPGLPRWRPGSLR
jgi:hypothetical protein